MFAVEGYPHPAILRFGPVLEQMQGAVSVDGEKLAAGQLELEAHAGDQLLFKVGKRRFARVTID